MLPRRVSCPQDQRLEMLKGLWEASGDRDETSRRSVDMVKDNLAQGHELVRQANVRGVGIELAVSDAGTVTADGHRSVMATGESNLPIDKRYLLAPAVSPEVFVSGRIQNPGPRPLLPGQVIIKHSGKPLGRTRIDFVDRQENFELALPSETVIAAERMLDSDNSHVAGLGGKTRLDVAYRISLENTASSKAEIRVIDQMPVSEDPGIEVELLQVHPRAELSDAGVLTWETALDSGQKEELTFSFRIIYPAKRVPPDILVLERSVRQSTAKRPEANR